MELGEITGGGAFAQMHKAWVQSLSSMAKIKGWFVLKQELKIKWHIGGKDSRPIQYRWWVITDALETLELFHQ